MNAPRRTWIELGMLLALGLFLLNAACMNVNDATLLSPDPSFEGEDQPYGTEVDDGSDGSPEDADAGVVAGGPGAPGVVSESQSPATGNGVRQEIDADRDSILLTCRHQQTGAVGTTRCNGGAVASFEIDEVRGDAEFTFVLTELPAAGSVGADLSFAAQITDTIECGGAPAFPLVQSGAPQQIVRVEVDPAAERCNVFLFMNAFADSTGGAATVLQTASVTARDVAPTECAHVSECASGELCGPSGICQTGGTAELCEIPALHCDVDHPFCTLQGCSGGHPGAPCRRPEECVAGATCVNQVCQGPACDDDADCPSEAPNCTTDLGCSAEGLRGQGCFSGFGCVTQLCFDGRCTELRGEGESCTEPDVFCDGALACFVSTGTCETRLPPGETCDADQECFDPIVNSCIGGVCGPKSGTGGPCESNVDCQFPQLCNPSTKTCGS